MLNDVLVVQSAVSAFNNAALFLPAFLWWALLSLPLFLMVWMCGDDFMAKIGWNKQNLLERASVWVAGLTFAWVVLFSGNYNVLRDNMSVLPMMTALLIFLSSLFVSSHLREKKFEKFGWRQWLVVLALLIFVGTCDMHAWWGPLLQIGALLFGFLLGRAARASMRPVGGTVLIVLTTTIAILMQPEFFRFGQLGNLTVLHLVAILLLGVVAMMTVAIFNIKSCAKLRDSVYVKLKWLLRVVSVLGCALFLLTEAVPVFVGTLAAVFVMFALSIWHANSISSVLGDKMLALTWILFGIITVMPVVSALGLIYWMNSPKIKFWSEYKALL